MPLPVLPRGEELEGIKDIKGIEGGGFGPVTERAELSFSSIEAIMARAVDAIEHSKEQIFGIAEAAHAECDKLRKELEALRDEARNAVEEVDRLERSTRRSRYRLMTVNQNFDRFKEDDFLKAYEEAERDRELLAAAREREKQLRARRDETDKRLRRMEELARTADGLTGNVGLALDFLRGNVTAMSAEWDEMRQRSVMAGRIILAQEEERRRVAREIHDGPAQAMANVVLRAEICERIHESGKGSKGEKGDLAGELSELKRIVKESLQEVRRIVFDLRPMTLDDLGLVPALRRYVDQTKDDAGFDIEVSVFGKERRLEATAEAALFRLIQEALTNVRKHAKASWAAVRVEFAPEAVGVIVEDSGVGFDVEKALRGAREPSAESGGYGLLGMRERVELLGGRFDITSHPRRGTRIVARVPLKEELGAFSRK